MTSMATSGTAKVTLVGDTDMHVVRVFDAPPTRRSTSHTVTTPRFAFHHRLMSSGSVTVR